MSFFPFVSYFSPVLMVAYDSLTIPSTRSMHLYYTINQYLVLNPYIFHVDSCDLCSVP